MTSTTLRSGLMTAVNQLAPTTNFEYQTKFGLRTLAGAEIINYLYFPLSAIPRGASITSAQLVVFNANYATAGSQTLSVKRLRQSVSMTQVTYKTRPTSLYPDAAKTVTKTGPIAGGTAWTFDVTSQVQSVANGDPWYGWELRGTFNPAGEIHGPKWPTTQHRPYLVLTWSAAPTPPTGLAPGGGRAVSLAAPVVRATYTDVGSDNALAAIQVQTNASNVWTAPAWDSGTVVSTSPELNLATASGFVGLAAGETRWWRMRVQDSNGLWSPWSLAESFVRTAKPVVTIGSPAASPNNFVSEATPPILWTVTGGSQKAYQINVAEPDDPFGSVLYSSGKITGTTDGFTLPAGVLKTNGKLYNLRVIVWDAVSREATPGDPAYSDASRDFTFELSNLTAPTTNMVATVNSYRPRITLAWQRSTAPDSFSIMRNGVVIATNLAAGDTFVSGTTYGWEDPMPLPGIAVTYQALAVVNGKASSGNAVHTVTMKPLGIWLASKGRVDEVGITGKDTRQWSYGETSEVIEVLGSTEVSVVTHSQRGLEGTVSGQLYSDMPVPGVSSVTWRDNLLRIKRKPGQVCYLTVADLCIPVVVRNVNITPRPTSTLTYDVSFEFYQVAG